MNETKQNRSPRITAISWGRIEIEGRAEPLKDARLYPGGARDWDWGETGTHHEPGISPADVEELIERGATVVVLGRGFNGRLQVQPDTIDLLEKSNIEVHVLKTEEAAALYNELREKEPVGGLFHTTC